MLLLVAVAVAVKSAKRRRWWRCSVIDVKQCDRVDKDDILQAVSVVDREKDTHTIRQVSRRIDV